MAVLARAVPVWERAHAATEALLADGDAGRLRSDLVALSESESDKINHR
jgi:hypothetical protein